MSLNKVLLIGNVGKDPEIRYLEQNTPNAQNPKVATIVLATSERYKDRNGETRENTEWHTITAWRSLADLADKYIRKGSQIYVEGRIRTRTWNDQSGAKRYSTEILADTIQLLGRRPDAQGSPAPIQAAPVQSSPLAASPIDITPLGDGEDDLPF